MRLKSIKLAGFKSFVDPTTVHFPGNLCAVVGPNGCGKSNIIDAVRWVMGESSAKTLRGESMTDVIFSGSGARKPVGQATVELIFDNSDGGFKGKYGTYNEISVRRTVSREMQSIYYLNGRRCRRRDIQDVFLGTGLGPRSYSIIEQGTISRFVEAKPDELRVYIEEAAGISKYKERRRETENRMRHAKENLERLADIREELGRQLHHLQRQSQAAKRYSELKHQERGCKAELQAIRWRALNDNHQHQEKKVSEVEIQLESVHAAQRSIETRIERSRQQHVASTEAYQAVQEAFYKVGTEIARYEQNIQNQQERSAQISTDLAAIGETLQKAKNELEGDELKISQLAADWAQLTPELKALRQQAEILSSEQETIEIEAQQCQQQWDEFNQHASIASQEAKVEQSRIGHLEQNIGRIKERISRLEEEQGGLDQSPADAAIKELATKIGALDGKVQQQNEHIAGLVASIRRQRDDNHQASSQLDQWRRNMQEKKGRLASLEALQQAALGQKDAAVMQWLEKNRLHKQPRLAQELCVEKGWEKAVEVVLGCYLQAVCMKAVGNLEGAIAELASGDMTLMHPVSSALLSQQQSKPNDASLRGRITTTWNLDSLLSGVSVAETLEEALLLRSQLGSSESVVTRDGIWIGRGWTRVCRAADEDSSVLGRQEELKRLGEKMTAQEERIERLEVDLDGGLLKLKNLEQARESGQPDLSDLTKQQAQLAADLSAEKARIEQLRARVQRVEHELEENRGQLKPEESRLAQARLAWEESMAQVNENAGRREVLVAARELNRERRESARSKARSAKDHWHQLALREQSITTQQEALQTGAQRLRLQRVQLETREQALESDWAVSLAPLESLREALQEKLQEKLASEQRLGAARAELERVEAGLVELEQDRSAAEQQAEKVRDNLEQQRMQWQTTTVQQETLENQLREMKQDLALLLEQLPEEANEADWEQKMERLRGKVQRLGPINLAAIDEYQTQLERKTYLDTQNEEIEEALATLENAIRKIDSETRIRFKETFDLINQKLQEFFPKVFGGGDAYLELTGDELLNTGVTVMARPPGKCNSTIHLLSGGEKALTAIAMVFAIFQLNPAPFCMLDEVDAPLDDANVSRYCRLVEAMSETVQFVFITHNKVTMEMAGQMIGVTMHEPGVSRLVSVDIDEAAALAAS